MLKETVAGSIFDRKKLSFKDFRSEILADYRLVNESRQASLMGRKEVLTGKAKFGIFGDGKEVAQVAMAKAFRNGDWRSGYYRDQTFMFAIGESDLEKFFAQLYANPDEKAEPSSAGRAMNGHFATRLLHPDGSWKNQSEGKNSSADISPTGSQMPRLVGLALASKLYRNNPALCHLSQFSAGGNEVAFGTIGDASTSEGLFFESINAAGVMQVPMAVSVWDDGYGISVPAKYQTTKESISEILKGFERTKDSKGYIILRGKGWDYPGLCAMYEKGIAACREQHVPVLFHIQEMTQPQGHSTSGSHERYKSAERLAWEQQFDCIRKMREWVIESGVALPEELDRIESEAKKTVSEARKKAWDTFNGPIREDLDEVAVLFDEVIAESAYSSTLSGIKSGLLKNPEPQRRDVMEAVKKFMRITRSEEISSRARLLVWLRSASEKNKGLYNSHLYSVSEQSALRIHAAAPDFVPDAPMVNGYEILNENFDAILAKMPEVIAFGEDVGNIGDVNQAFAGLQKKYGEMRVSDTGIREATIIGQGIGLALRGLRPIAEIQYLDYLLYALQILSDDLACLQYRTKGGQKAPLIIRTRGHRLEGIWHSGSPLGMILGALRGIYVCVPRNMTQAAGFYNTLLASDDPGLIIEPLNAYRFKERKPSNPGEYRLPLGISEILKEGTDITLVSYGSTCRIVLDVTRDLAEAGISAELIDVQTLLPFDINHTIAASIRKTGKILFIDEDVPGGATAYMMQQLLEEQQGFRYLDSEPRTLTAQAHRPAYGTDGDYFSKPNAEDIFDAVYAVMHEYDPERYPSIY